MPVDEIMWRVNVDRVVEIFTVYIKYVWKSLNTFNLETFAIHLGRLKKKKCPWNAWKPCHPFLINLSLAVLLPSQTSSGMVSSSMGIKVLWQNREIYFYLRGLTSEWVRTFLLRFDESFWHCSSKRNFIKREWVSVCLGLCFTFFPLT